MDSPDKKRGSKCLELGFLGRGSPEKEVAPSQVMSGERMKIAEHIVALG